MLQEVLLEFPRGSPQERLANTFLALERIEEMVQLGIKDMQLDCNDLLLQLSDPPLESGADRKIPFVFFHTFAHANKYKTPKPKSINLKLDTIGIDKAEVLMKIAYGYFRNCSGLIEAIDLYKKSKTYVHWRKIRHKDYYVFELPMNLDIPEKREKREPRERLRVDPDPGDADDSDEWTDIDDDE